MSAVVLAEAGTLAIEQLREGDLVWAFDEHTGEKALKRVVQTFVNETKELVHINAAGEEIICTPSHPFYCVDRGWVEAGALKHGDVLFLKSGEQTKVNYIYSEQCKKPVKVYNFEVEDFHTYFVGENGILVHNTCSVSTQRRKAVKEAWKQERKMVATTGRGSRKWNSKQKVQLLTRGKVRGYQGHHIKSVNSYPSKAGNWRNIQFLTRKEHLRAHWGNWRYQSRSRYFPGIRYQRKFRR